MEWMLEPESWIALITLTVLEIVLGIDNIVFISIFVEPLPPGLRDRARIFGLALAMLTRIGLLLTLVWIMRLTTPLFTVFGQDISGRDIILIGGGVFLLVKSTLEIHSSLEGGDTQHAVRHAGKLFLMIIIQIAIIDIIFSLDSVITAVGMAQRVEVMAIAIIIAVIIMMMASGTISEIIYRHPTIKMLALSFLVLIGIALISEGFDKPIPKGYLYFAIAFSVAVEFLNIRIRGRTAEPLDLYGLDSEAKELERRKEAG
ncbi:MAG: TerC family protein [Gammaproteobacteria bacterium]|nr:TerC family protein [Gammaproteobacteria bacterium]